MPIAAPLPLVLNGHVWVALDGATLSDASNVIKPSGDSSSPTVVGSAAKPSAADTAWVKLGRVGKVDVNREDGQAHEIWTPSPGVQLLGYVIRTKQKRSYKITCQDVSPLAIQLAFRTLTLSGSSTQFNPGEGPNATNAWVKMQFYTHKNVEGLRVEFWADIDMKSFSFDPDNPISPEFEAMELFNVLNTGTLPNALT